jgi:hypothetical protein
MAKVGRAAIPKAAGLAAEVEPEALRAAGEAGEAGGQAAKEYKTGLKTRPQTPGQAIPYYQEAGEAIARGGWMPKHLTRTALGTAAADVLTAGHLPSWAATAAGATAAAGSSPRLAGATMYGLGAMERRAKELPTMWDAYAAAKVPANRAVIRADAQAILRDKEKKNQLEPDQIKTLRTATRPDADSNAMLAAQRVLTPLSMGAMLPKSPQERINIGHMAAPDYRENNFDAAMSNLKLNKQEQFLYRMHLQNLRSGGVPNPAGGTSTLFMSTFEIDGKTYVIPTVWKGQIVKPDQALAYAKQMGLEKFPSYDSENEAEKRYNAMHGFMEKDLPTPSSYGGIGGGRSLESTRATAPQTPAPGQPSQPRSPAAPTPPAQMQAPPIGPIEKPSSRFADKVTELWQKALKGISPISEARAGEVIPIKRSPLKVVPKPQSPATSEAMESIDKMMDALRGPIKRP